MPKKLLKDIPQVSLDSKNNILSSLTLPKNIQYLMSASCQTTGQNDGGLTQVIILKHLLVSKTKTPQEEGYHFPSI